MKLFFVLFAILLSLDYSHGTAKLVYIPKEEHDNTYHHQCKGKSWEDICEKRCSCYGNGIGDCHKPEPGDNPVYWWCLDATKCWCMPDDEGAKAKKHKLGKKYPNHRGKVVDINDLDPTNSERRKGVVKGKVKAVMDSVNGFFGNLNHLVEGEKDIRSCKMMTRLGYMKKELSWRAAMRNGSMKTRRSRHQVQTHKRITHSIMQQVISSSLHVVGSNIALEEAPSITPIDKQLDISISLV